MKSYLELVKRVLKEGTLKDSRTGTKCLTMSGGILEHDMKEGFPLLTTKKMNIDLISAELEFFIKGITKKSWLKERKCNIWNDWSAPYPNTSDDELGPIYGKQWRCFNGNRRKSEGIDQLKNIVDELKQNPNSRRLLVNSWNPSENKFMALPPCHVLFHLVHIDGTLNLNWFQRSCDLMLGIPFNIASYSILLYLLAKESNLKVGKVIGMLSDIHIYENHIEGAKIQLKRKPKKLPKFAVRNFKSIFKWNYKDISLSDYDSYDSIRFKIGV